MRSFLKKQHNIITFLVITSLFASTLLSFVSFTNAAANYEINYQGKLMNASNVAVADGTYNMRFWLLTTPSIATTSAVWTESLTSTNKVQVTNGVFSVMLGSTTPFTGVDFNQTLYLGVEIGGTGSPTWDGEMSPRKVLGAVPAAFYAATSSVAETLDGLDSTQFVRTDTASTIASSSASTLLTITQSGTGDILNLFDGVTEVFSVLDGGNIGIGTTTPSYKLTVQGGDTYLGGNLTATGTLTLSAYTGGVLTTDGNGIVSASTTIGSSYLDSAVILSSEIDTLAEIETLAGVTNILLEGDIDASSELLAIMDDETGTGNLVFSTNPLFEGFRSNASSTIGGGTGATGLTIFGGATTTGDSRVSGNVYADSGLIYFDDTTGWINRTSAGNTLQFVPSGGTIAMNLTSSRLGLGSDTSSSGYTANRFFLGSNASSGGSQETVWFGASSRGGNSGSGHNVVVGGGDGSTATTGTIGGNVSIVGGDAGGTGDNNGGSVYIDGGAKTFGGTAGNIILASVLGNVGIGTTTPSAKLSISQGVGGSGNLFQIASSSNGTATTTHFVVDQYGNIGVGTTSPAALFHVGRSDTTALTDILVDPLTKSSGNLLDLKVAGSSKFTVSSTGGVTIAGGQAFSGNITTTSVSPSAYTQQLAINGGQTNATGAIKLSTMAENSNTSGSRYVVGITPTYNQTSGTAANTDFLINRTETALGSGAQYLIDAQAGSVSKFNVSNVGVGYFAGNVGIGTTSPSRALTIAGGDIHVGGIITSTSTSATSTLPWLTSTNLAVTGMLYDGAGTPGTNGMVLQTTGAGVQWVATSSLGITSGSSFSDSSELAALLSDETGTGLSVFNTDPLLTGFRSNASSTIGDGTATGGLTIYGGATTTGNAYFGGNVGVAMNPSSAKLAIDGSATVTGSELITNGSFTGSATGWTLQSGCSVYNSNNVLVTYDVTCQADADWPSLSTTFESVAGRTYLLTFTLSAVAGDQVYYHFGNNTIEQDWGPFMDGTQSVAFTTNYTGTETITFENWFSNDGSTWTIDNVSLVEIATATPAFTVKGYNGSNWLSLGGDILANTSLGNNALANNTLGIYNTAFGYSSLRYNTIGEYNNAFGGNTLVSNISGSNNNALGESALYFNTTGNGNNAFGEYSLYFNTTGSNNAAYGGLALADNTIGSSNTAIGTQSLRRNTTGSNNAAFGSYASYNNVSATNTTAIGFETARGSALYSNQGGVYLGYQAGYSAETGSDYNTLLGYQAGYGVTTGANNILVGSGAGYSGTNLVTGTKNIIIGYNVGATSTNMTNGLNIGNLIFGTGVDGTGTTLSTGNIGIGTTTPAQKFSVAGGMHLTGALYDRTYNPGTNGMVLQTTGTGVQWVATSSLGISGGAALSGGIDGYLARWTSDSAISTGILLDNGTVAGVNATSSTSTFLVRGVGNTNPFTVASSTGSQLLTIDTRGALMFGTSTTLSDIYINGGPTSTPTQTLSNNIAIGNEAYSYASTTSAILPNNNIAIGYQALMGSSSVPLSGYVNVALGYQSLKGLTSGVANTAVGASTLTALTSGTFNTATGYSALVANISGNYNNAFGGLAMSGKTSGSSNNAFGYGALQSNVAGGSNNVYGASALASNTDGSNNSVFGGAMILNKSGSNNSVFGEGALFLNGTSTNNSIFGYQAMYLNSGENGYNSAFGSESLWNSGTSYNAALGNRAGYTLSTGSANTFLGAFADVTTGTVSTSTAIGYQAKVGCSNCMVLGGTGVNAVKVGIATTTPSRTLTVIGDGYFSNGVTFSSTTATNASSTYASSTALSLYGRLYDSASSAGTNGYILQTTGAGVQWVATSSLGISASQWTTSGSNIYYNTGNIGIGTSTPDSLLSLYKTGLTGSVIGGAREHLQFINSTESAVYYGDNAYIVNAPTATSTLVGKMIRIEDSTSLGNTVRGLEVQAYRGTNTKGENTALSGFARTFGVRGTTLGDAGGTYLPAGVYAETQGTTQGNALRAYSGTITTEDLVSIFHDTSAFSGTALQMNLGNTTGSFAATSSAKFFDLQVAGTSRFTVTSAGTTTIGDGTTTHVAGLQIGYGGLCVDNDGSCTASTTGRITSVSSATGNSDLAEIYFSSQALRAGEIVALSGGLSVRRADTGTESDIVGVVSTKPGLLLGFDDTSLIVGEASFPIGLKGRVPIKLSTENGPIKKGDRIMLSSIAGIGMKATENARVVGIALEDWGGERAYTAGFLNQFGDDLVKEKLAPRSVNDDVRTQDGCYYGGGGALGEEECSPEEEVTLQVTVPEVDTSRADALRELEMQQALDMSTASGQSVEVGQALMFIELGSYQSATTTTMLAELVDASVVENGNGTETLWDRVKVLAQNFVDGVLAVAGIKTDRVETRELCVDGVCVTGEQLRALLNGSGQTSGGATSGDTYTPPPADSGTGEVPPPETPTTDPGTVTPPPESAPIDGGSVSEPIAEPTPEPAVETPPAPAPEPEPVVEPAPEPAPEPPPEPTPEPSV